MSSSTARRRVYTNATIITVNPARDIILNGALLVQDAQIAAIGPTNEILESIHAAGVTDIINLDQKILIPGLINAHAHVAQSLLRGLAEELDLHDWLCSAIWPLEAAFSGDDGYVAARLTIAEMLKSGTTTFLEAMLTYRTGLDNVIRAVDESGIRACLGKLVKPKETNTATGMVDARDRDVDMMSVQAALDAHSLYNGSCNSRVNIWMALGTPRGNDASFHSIAALSAYQNDMGITMHCAEAPRDLEIYQQHYSCSPMQFCEKYSIAGPQTVLAHMVNLDIEKDLPLLKKTGTSVAHNPSSNCKLGSGIAAIPDMLAAGINVSLGTDGAPCANTYDMIREMNLACLLQSGLKRKAGVLSSPQALEMATINAARALGLEKEIGSLEVGKKADFVVIDPYSIGSAATPWDAEQYVDGGLGPVTALVHSCTGRDVDLVVVDGEILVQEGKLVRVVETDIIRAAREAIKAIRQSSTLKTASRRS